MLLNVLQQERPLTPERPKVHRCTQTEPFLHLVTQYIIEHPGTVMLLLGLEPMSNMTPVIEYDTGRNITPGAEYYDTRGRRPSMLEQIVESENGSQTPSSSGSERVDHRSLSGSAKELDSQKEVKRLLEDCRPTNLRRNRYSASDICEESERLLSARAQHPSTRSLKFNINN